MSSPIMATITFDMDELDVLAEGYGINHSFKPVVYEKAVPRILELLDDVGIEATFFIIAKDLDSNSAKLALREISSCGHELGNHSWNHQHLLNMSASATRLDTVQSTQLISDISGQPISGYRGPSLTLNRYLMDILIELGYEYDSSINPTFFFIFEWLYLTFTSSTKRNRPRSFYLRHGLAKSQPYLICPPSFFRRVVKGELIELPISHVPFLMIPYYATFHFLFPFSYRLFKRLIFLNEYFVYHAHALDFLDIEADVIHPEFAKHPGLRMPWKEKKRYFANVFSELKGRYGRIATAREMARTCKKQI